MLKLKLQYFGHLMQRTDSLERPWCWERLRPGGEGDDRGWDGWMASPTQWTWVWINSWSWWWAGRPGELQSMGSEIIGHDWATELKIRVKPKWPSAEELIKMWRTYAMECYSGMHKKEWNGAVCCNMHGPRKHFTIWSKSDGERQVLCGIYVCNLEKIYTNELI